MKKEGYLEHYPFWILFFSNLVSISIYLIGTFIIYQIGLIWAALYFLFACILEFRLLSRHCVNCYYYGKICAFGKGRISSLFFKKGNAREFCKMKITWKDILPDFMISLIPMITGIMILIRNFNWIMLILVLLLFLLTFIGNAVIRSQLTCKYCKQRKLGCPAQELFEKRKK